MSHDPKRRTIGDHKLHPDTLMVGYGYDPALSEGAVKPPVFLTSTFVFRSAEEGRDFFDVVSGRKPRPEGGAGLVYARFNHPNSEIVEDRLAVLEGAEQALTFNAGMAAIATTIFAHARPGDVVLHSQPLYGGTETLLLKTLQPWGILSEGFVDGTSEAAIGEAAERAAARGRVAMILVETPSNPVNSLVDLALVARVADRLGGRQGTRPPIACDNTMLGPVFQSPLRHGADIAIYSLTKYIGGHSDLVGGAAIGPAALLAPIRQWRSAIGTNLEPYGSWLVGRSLETLSLRMRAAAANAERVADFLASHRHVQAVHALGPHIADPAAAAVYARQCTGPGSTFAVTLRGGEAEAFAVLNALTIFRLAVSLGGTESLASHPASTTHSGVPAETRALAGVSGGLIRLSIGIENADDLIADLDHALAVLD